jgi:hypothetical protein
MKHIVELKKLFGSILGWHSSRITFLALFITSMLQEKTVNLSAIANGFATKGKRSGKIRRVEDFFRKFKIDYDEIAKLLSSFIENLSKWTLTMDRTNWQFGKININILYLAIAYKSVAIPLFWAILEKKDENDKLYIKKGNSNTTERIDIIERFIKVFSVDRIEILTADREFVGGKWFKYLNEKGIKFCIREKQGKIINHKGKEIVIKSLFQNLELNEYRQIETIKMYGIELSLTGGRLEDDYLLIITNYKSNTDEVLATYSKRWEIETMFKAFKAQGFNLENTHLTKKDRIEKLLALMAIAFVWSYITGEYFEKIEPIKLKKKTVNQIQIEKHRERSIFRHGLEYLTSILNNIHHKMEEFLDVLLLFGMFLNRVKSKIIKSIS